MMDIEEEAQPAADGVGENNNIVDMQAQAASEQCETMDEVEWNSDATFRFTLRDFSNLAEPIFSDPIRIRNLPWKIKAMPRNNRSEDMQLVKCLGLYLVCDMEPDTTKWWCTAYAEFRLLRWEEGCGPFVKEFRHLFNPKSKDFGFGHFMRWKDVVDPLNQFIKDDVVVLEVYVFADAPHGVGWDSKRFTGYVGLNIEGATGYLNSLVQALFFMPKLRMAVYNMPRDKDHLSKSVELSIQRIFYDLQCSDKPVPTRDLVHSFGCEALYSFMQHDVQEISRVLLESMEMKMKGTCVEGIIPWLFEGKMVTFVRYKDLNYVSSHTEAFYNLKLNIRGKKNIYESLQDYVSVKTVRDVITHDAGECKIQVVKKLVKFASFPRVLHLHLMRFDCDYITTSNTKGSDRFDIPKKLVLNRFLRKPGSHVANYTLCAVLVRIGDDLGGHYSIFINPRSDGKWFKFDDDVVSSCTEVDGARLNLQDSGDIDTNARLLVYIRNDAIDDILAPVTKDDIPEKLVERLDEEKLDKQLLKMFKLFGNCCAHQWYNAGAVTVG